MADDDAAPDGELTEASDKEASSPSPETSSSEIETPSETEAASKADASSESETISEADTAVGSDETDDAPAKSRMSHVRMAMIAGLVVVGALAGLTGWLGYRAYEAYQTEQQRELFLQVGRQGALNLTTISHEQAEADVQRVLDSATGTFYDDFQQRADPFIEVVKQAQSKSEGTISEAGLESVSDDEAQVLVAVTVETSNAGAPEQQPRAWRMRLTVQQTGEDEAKVSNVEFVP